jgi:signal transduction histidine kinase
LNRSIRKNILVILLVAQGLLTAVCATALVIYVNKQRMGVVDAELGRRTGLLVAGLQIDDHDPAKLVFAESQTPTHGDLYVIRESSGSLVSASRDPGAFPEVIVESADGFSFTFNGKHYRARVRRNIPIIDQDEENSTSSPPMAAIWYAMPLDDFDRASRNILLIAIAGSLFWVASSCLIAWFSVTRGMAPLAELAKQAATITERSWALSLSPDVKKVFETRPLALALEALVARLSDAFQRERTFVNDAAHELKTVVAIQKSSLQVALHGDATALEYRNGLERALEDVDRLNALVHRMLSLASIEGSDPTRVYEAVELEETILAACDQVAPLAAANSTTIKTELYEHNSIASEEGLLQSLWVILLENSIQYSHPQCPVTISCSRTDQFATVIVEDHGAGIDAEGLPHIFERFYRGDASRSRDTGGFGLGLAIAKAIVEKHLGQIEIKSIRGAGTIVRVILPHTTNMP